MRRGIRLALVFGALGLALVTFAPRSRAGDRGGSDAAISVPSGSFGVDAGAMSLPGASNGDRAPAPQPETSEASKTESLGSRYRVPLPAPAQSGNGTASVGGAPAAAGTTPINPLVTAAADDAFIARAQYDVFSYEHAKKVFSQQRMMTWVIFFVVLLLVAVGLVFSWYQFRLGIKQTEDREARINRREKARDQALATGASLMKGNKHPAAAPPESPDSEPPPLPVTEFSAGPEGFKISSPVIGLVILAMSLGFFYLYLKYVYPIVNIDRP